MRHTYNEHIQRLLQAHDIIEAADRYFGEFADTTATRKLTEAKALVRAAAIGFLDGTHEHELLHGDQSIIDDSITQERRLAKATVHLMRRGWTVKQSDLNTAAMKQWLQSEISMMEPDPEYVDEVDTLQQALRMLDGANA